MTIINPPPNINVTVSPPENISVVFETPPEIYSVSQGPDQINVAVSPGDPGIPAGGTIGQVLTKLSSGNYAVTWANPVGEGGATNLTVVRSGSTVTIESDTGTNAELLAADGTNAGVLSASDKLKLDGIEPGAEVNTVNAIPDLADVVLTNLQTGEILKYNGTSWVNAADEGGSGETNLTTSRTAEQFVIESDTGTNATVPSADSTNAGALTAADKTKLDGIESGAEVNTVDSVAGKTGEVELVKADVGLANVDNTSDAAKPISTATQTALNDKADVGHGHAIADVTGLQDELDSKASTTHTHTLESLDNVTIDAPSTGQVIKYDGTNWINDEDETASGEGATNLSTSRTATNVTVQSDTGTNALIDGADATNAGVLTSADKIKLDGIEAGAEANTVDSVAGKTGEVTLIKDDVGLANVDNTADADKPVSTATQTALDGKSNTGHGHVINDVTGLQAALDDKTDVSVTDAIDGRVAILESPAIFNLTDATTIATDASAGRHFRVGIEGNRTLGVPTNAVDGMRRLWEITAVGANRTLTLSTSAGGFESASTELTIASGLRLYLGAVYRSSINRWVVLAQSDVESVGGATNLSITRDATTVTVENDTGTDAILPAATTTDAGVLTAADKTKLDGIETGAEANTVDSVAGKTGEVTLVKADVGLANVDNTSDADKPVSTATQAALDGKANTSHTHVIDDTTGLQTTLDAKIEETDLNAAITAALADAPRVHVYDEGWPAVIDDGRIPFFTAGDLATDAPDDPNIPFGAVWIPLTDSTP